MSLDMTHCQRYSYKGTWKAVVAGEELAGKCKGVDWLFTGAPSNGSTGLVLLTRLSRCLIRSPQQLVLAGQPQGQASLIWRPIKDNVS